MNKLRVLAVLFLISVLFLIHSGCVSTSGTLKLGQTAAERRDWDSAVQHFLTALDRDPGNIEVRIVLSKALLSASSEHTERASGLMERDEYAAALIELDKALEFNPENNEARRMKVTLLKEMERKKNEGQGKTRLQLAQEEAYRRPALKPEVDPDKKNYDLVFNTERTLAELFKHLQKASGVNFIVESTIKDKKVPVNFNNLSLNEILDIICLTAELFYKVIDEQTVMILPDKPVTRKKHEELVIRTFYLSNSEPKEMKKLIAEITGLRKISEDSRMNALTVSGLPEEVRLAELVIRRHDKAQGEVLISIEIMEVNKGRMQNHGIELSSYTISQTYNPSGIVSETTTPVMRMNQITHTDTADYLLSIPSVNYMLLRSDSRSKIKARPQVRVIDRGKVNLVLGDKVPILQTTFVSQFSGQVNNQPISSFNLQDVGITLKMTPIIHHDGWVTLELEFEFSFITNPGDSNKPPTIGRRELKTQIRLRDGETGILAGLLRDNERKSVKGIPGIIDLPILREIFGGNRNETDQTDIILTLSPQIVRFPHIDEEDLQYRWIGTEERLGLVEPKRRSGKEPLSESQDIEAHEEKKEEPATESVPNRPKEKNAGNDEMGESPMPVAIRIGSIRKGSNDMMEMDLFFRPRKMLRQVRFLIKPQDGVQILEARGGNDLPGQVLSRIKSDGETEIIINITSQKSDSRDEWDLVVKWKQGFGELKRLTIEKIVTVDEAMQKTEHPGMTFENSQNVGEKE